MDPLDFSELTDDQLVGLIRAALRECVSRGAAVQAAAQYATLDEAERAKAAREGAEREAAKLRAAERERVAREAAESVRRQQAEQESAARAAREQAETERQREAARRAADEAVSKVEARERQRREWLQRAADLVGLHPSQIHLSRADTSYRGWRVLINAGSDRYTRDHLADYYPATAVLKTKRSLIGRKKELLALCAEFWALNPNVQTTYQGSDLFPIPEEASSEQS